VLFEVNKQFQYVCQLLWDLLRVYLILNLIFDQIVVMETEMKRIWENPEDPVGYTGVSKLAKRVKASQKQTSKWLRNQMSYSLHKPMRRRFPTRKYKTSGINHLWQADLMEMIPYASINDGYKYILTCIDVFSRYARAVPVKSKSKKDMKEAMAILLEDEKPLNLQTDLGKEFYNGDVKALLENNGINHYSVFSQFKAALVERFNRTLRSRLTKYFTKQGNKKWITVLPKIILAYNHSEHRGLTGLRPIDVNGDNAMKIWADRNHTIVPKKPKYSVGDYVRISRISSTPFIKNFNHNWSDEVFQIARINKRQNPIMYTIKDDDGEIIQGKFYELELQVLPEKPNIYRIERVLETKGRGNHKQLLVKWVGYNNPQWIKADQLV